jgi:hypothetical protein
MGSNFFQNNLKIPKLFGSLSLCITKFKHVRHSFEPFGMFNNLYMPYTACLPYFDRNVFFNTLISQLSIPIQTNLHRVHNQSKYLPGWHCYCSSEIVGIITETLSNLNLRRIQIPLVSNC